MVRCIQIASSLMALLLSGILVQVSSQTLVPTTAEAEISKYNTAFAKWNTVNPQYYNYDLTAYCGGCVASNYPWEHNVEILVVKGVDSKGNLLSSLSSIADWFKRIQTAINTPSEHVYAEYDPTYGYPTRFQIANVDAFGAVSNMSERIIPLFRLLTGSARTLYNQNFALWNSRNILNYRYQYVDLADPSNNIAWPRTVTVQNGVVTATTDPNGNPMTGAWPFTNYFVLIDRLISANSPYIEIYYDPTFGFPTLIYVIDNARGKTYTTFSSFQLI
jgi:Family of unknown function (DUF6174)